MQEADWQYNSNHAQDRCMQAIILLFWAKVVMESGEQQYSKWCLQGVKLLHQNGHVAT